MRCRALWARRACTCWRTAPSFTIPPGPATFLTRGRWYDPNFFKARTTLFQSVSGAMAAGGEQRRLRQRAQSVYFSQQPPEAPDHNDFVFAVFCGLLPGGRGATQAERGAAEALPAAHGRRGGTQHTRGRGATNDAMGRERPEHQRTRTRRNTKDENPQNTKDENPQNTKVPNPMAMT